jgi:hypothetical protein
MDSKFRTIGRIAAVGAVALVLAGSATSVEARPRSDVVRTANRMIGSCFVSGGEANVEDHGSGMTYSCVYSDGTEYSHYLPYD